MAVITAAGTAPLQVEATDRKKKRNSTMPISKYFKGKGRKVMGDMRAPSTLPPTNANPSDDDGDEAMMPAAHKAMPKKRKGMGQQLRERA